jgi:hypothetical protein
MLLAAYLLNPVAPFVSGRPGAFGLVRAPVILKCNPMGKCHPKVRSIRTGSALRWWIPDQTRARSSALRIGKSVPAAGGEGEATTR